MKATGVQESGSILRALPHPLDKCHLTKYVSKEAVVG